MHILLGLAVGTLATFAWASPAPAAMITPAPSPTAVRALKARDYSYASEYDDIPCDVSLVSSSSSVESLDHWVTSTSAICLCTPTPGANAPPVIQVAPSSSVDPSNKPWVMCGARTVVDPGPPLFTTFPKVLGPNIPYGDLDPVKLLSAISSACSGANGCNSYSTSTTTATTIVSGITESGTPVPTTAAGGAKARRGPGSQWKTLDITYVVDAKVPDADDYTLFFETLFQIIEASNSQNQVTERGFPATDPYATYTQWIGPTYIGIDRWGYDEGQQEYVNDQGSMSIEFKNFVPAPPGITCDEITGPIGAGIGLIPGGGFFGAFASVFCDAFQ